MDTLDEISLRMKITNLEARLALIEIKSASMLREIKSPLISLKRTNQIRQSLDTARGEEANLLAELDRIRQSHPNIRH